MPVTQTSAPAKTSAPSAPCAEGALSCGLYLAPAVFEGLNNEQVREKLSAHGEITTIRIKRSPKVKTPFALVWFSSPEAAAAAQKSIKAAMPAIKTIDPIMTATPGAAATSTTLYISPVDVPARDSAAFDRMIEQVRAQFPDALKSRLNHENDGTGSAMIYFKTAADCTAAKERLAGKFLDKSVNVTHSRRIGKSKRRNRKGLSAEARAEAHAALSKKIADPTGSGARAPSATELTIRAAGAKDGAADLLQTVAASAQRGTALAKQDRKIEAREAGIADGVKSAHSIKAANAAVKVSKESKPLIISKGSAPAKTPMARTVARQPNVNFKTESAKAKSQA